jgi:hypothetical protein
VNRTTLLGIALIVLGILGLTYSGASYHALPKRNIYEPVPTPKSRKRVHPAVDSVALPAVGALLLLGGAAVLLMDHEKRNVT